MDPNPDPKPKVHRQIVLAEEIAAGIDFLHHLVADDTGLGVERDEGADGVAIRDSSLELDFYPVVGIAAVVSVEDRRGAMVYDEHIWIAVVVVVETEQSSPQLRVGHANGVGDVGKYAVVVPVEVRLVGRVGSQPLVTTRSRSRSLS